MNNMKNNTMISFQEIIESYFKEYDIYIPLIQRNYKWPIPTARQLAIDLWNAYQNKRSVYTIGMITLFEEPQASTNSKPNMQLIDGQQRIITLFMLLQFLKSKCTSDIDFLKFFNFRFERDGTLDAKDTRQAYLKNIASPKSSDCKMTPDKNRFQENFNAIEKALEQQEGFEDLVNSPQQTKEFIDYIGKNLYFLLHITPNTPLSEFLNINKNKTRFVVSDRIKAHLIIDSKTKGEEGAREEILALFKNFSKILFNNATIWNLICRGYIKEDIPDSNEPRSKNHLYPDENRLKLLCCDRYGTDEHDVQSISGYEYEEELGKLHKLHKILQELQKDIGEGNLHSHNGFACLNQLDPSIRFFYHTPKDSSSQDQAASCTALPKDFLCNAAHLEEYLLHCWQSIEPFAKNCFIDTQLSNNKEINIDFSKQFKEIKKIKDAFKSNTQSEHWIYTGQEDFQTFEMIYQNYIQEKYKGNVIL